MKIFHQYLLCAGILTLFSAAPFASEAPPPASPASSPAATPPAAAAALIRFDPLADVKAKSLHYASEDPAAPESAARMASRQLHGAPGPLGNVSVGPPLPIYNLDIQAMARGAGLETATTRSTEYVIDSDGKPYAETQTLKMGNGPARASSLQYAGQGLIISEATDALEALPKLAVMDQLKNGSYEVRLIRSTPAVSLSALWLKSDKGDGDFLYTLPNRFPSGLEEHHLYAMPEFLKIFQPHLQRAMGLPTEMPLWNSESQMQDYFVTCFKASDNFGFKRMPSPEMALNDSMQLTVAGQSYGLDKLELIGVSKHDTPVAFVAKRHAADSTDFPTRPLTDFEKDALAQFAKGKNTASQPEANGRIVVGAIRAEQSCLQCHPGAKEGDVLGAFSYHLYAIKLQTPAQTSTIRATTTPAQP